MDRAAGGGMVSVRALSAGPGLLLLAGSFLLAWEALRPRRGAFLAAALLLSTSSWLLSTARWGWHAVSSSALLVLSAAAALRGARASSAPARTLLALLSGALLGLAQLGYPSAWLLLPLPAVACAVLLPFRSRPWCRAAIRTALLAAVAALVVSAPLLAELVRHPERVLARPRALTGSEVGPLAVGRCAAAYVRLFLVGGDEVRRHGDPDRPPLPVLVTALALAGALLGARRDGRSLLLSAAVVLVLAGGVLATGNWPNAYRVSCAAPFLLVLAASGGAALTDLLPSERLHGLEGLHGLRGRRAGALALCVLYPILAATEVATFLSWVSDPALRAWFGGPERELADAVTAARASWGAAPFALEPGAVRTPILTDTLLGSPAGSGAPGPLPLLAADALEARRAVVPAGALLWAAGAGGPGVPRAARLGGIPVAAGGPIGASYAGWVLFRFPPRAP